MDFTKIELDMIGRLVDSSKEGIVSRLISLEAIAPKLDEVHKRYYKAWKEHVKLSEKIDKMRGLS